jgi:hypothetical protein
MKRKFKLLGIGVLLILFGVFVFIDIKHDIPEHYKISGVDFSLFRVTGQNHSTKCFILQDSIKSVDSIHSNDYLLGIRFKLDYFSLTREHLWNPERYSWGGMGHIDSIREFSIWTPNNKRISNIYLSDASKYRGFYFSNLDKWVAHHGDEKGCYDAQTYKSVDEFIIKYNENNDTVAFKSTDYLLFKVPDSIARDLIRGNSKLVLKLSDGRIVEGRLK